MTAFIGHRPDAIQRTPNGRYRAACSCGWYTTPRVSKRVALEALEAEHGWTTGEWSSSDPRRIDRLVND